MSFRVEFRNDDRPPLILDAGWLEEDGSFVRFFKSGRITGQIINTMVAAIPVEVVRAIVSTDEPSL